MIGGDITYDNNMPTCYIVWDLFLTEVPYSRIENENIRLIPLVLATGNHDMGVNSNSGHSFLKDSTQPVYFHWFPQSISNSVVTPFDQRTSYFSHTFGSSLLLVSADTAYYSSIE